MPNAARLVAAISLALLAFLLSALIKPLLPEGTGFGYFTHVNVVLGLLVGWIVMGKRAGRGWTAAVNNGLTGMAALFFWGLFAQGTYEMMRQALRNRFDGPFEAVLAIFEIGVEYAWLLIAPSIVFTALAGGVLAGLATESSWRRWR